MHDRASASMMGLAALFAQMRHIDGLPEAYQPRAVAHQLRRNAIKPSHAKRAKVKAARKQRRRQGKHG